MGITLSSQDVIVFGRDVGWDFDNRANRKSIRAPVTDVHKANAFELREIEINTESRAHPFRADRVDHLGRTRTTFVGISRWKRLGETGRFVKAYGHSFNGRKPRAWLSYKEIQRPEFWIIGKAQVWELIPW